MIHSKRKTVFSVTGMALCMMSFACGGGGDDAPDAEFCQNDVCTSVNEDEDGNFTIGVYIEDDATDGLPALSVSNSDTLTITCDDGDTTEGNSLAYFDCNFDGWDGYDFNVWCDHGEIVINYDGTSYLTGCGSLDHYCTEDYGLRSASGCNDSSADLVKGETADQPESLEIKTWLKSLESFVE